MYKALTDKPHTQGLENIEVIKTEKLDALFRLGQDASLDPDPLSSDFVACRDTSHPVDDVRYPKRDDDSQPLPKCVDHNRMTREQDLFGLDFFRGGKGNQIGVAEPALDGHRLDGFTAYRTGFRIVIHLASLSPRQFRAVVVEEMTTVSHC